jgi:protein SCO1
MAQRQTGARAALLACALAVASFGAAANRWGADYFPNIELKAHDGSTVRFYDDVLKGKSVAVNVIYTSCTDECPLETARLVQLQRELGERVGKDIFFYSISIDPVHDTPALLKAYAEKFGVGPGWLFLTGKPEEIRIVTRKLGLSRNSDSNNRDGHTASLMVGNEPSGQWMRHSAVDNPQFLAATIGTFLGWKDARGQRSYAEVRALDLPKGQYLFESRCSACHTVGQGDRIGPDLANVTLRRERKWVASYIVSPDRLRAQSDPTALALSQKYPDVRMPNLGLGAVDAAEVMAYLEARSASLPQKGHDHAVHDHGGHDHPAAHHH